MRTEVTRSRARRHLLDWVAIEGCDGHDFTGEILSPEDRMPRVIQKLADYAGMGIRTIIVVDPGADEVWIYRGGTLSRQVPTELPGTLCTIDWEAVRVFLR